MVYNLKQIQNGGLMMVKGNKAITLVALVITIIVMLILARCNNKYYSKWRII